MKENIEIIDCFGDICPIPIIKIEKRLKTAGKGDEFLVVTDHSCTLESIKDKFKKKNMITKIDEVMNGVWEIYFKIN